MADLGRSVKYGIGKETTGGTAVAASRWLNQLSFEFNPHAEYINNESSYGVIERTNNSDIIQKWSEGSLEAKLTDQSSGFILLGTFGSVTTTTNADASGNVKDHTFNINQNINGQSFTLVRKDSLATEAFALARFGEFELSFELDDYVKFTSDLMARKAAATTATPAYTDETEFVAKHISVKTATNVAGLSGATNVATVESFTLNVNPNIEPDFAAGSEDPYGFSSRGYEMSFEMTVRNDNKTYETAYMNGTPLALQVQAQNTDVTIGTSARPGLRLTAPKMNITDWTRNEDMDGPVTETMTGTIHYSAADAYTLRAVLTNLVTSY